MMFFRDRFWAQAHRMTARLCDYTARKAESAPGTPTPRKIVELKDKLPQWRSDPRNYSVILRDGLTEVVAELAYAQTPLTRADKFYLVEALDILEALLYAYEVSETEIKELRSLRG